ncbi:MAG: hypothetical protein AAGE52_17375 [Myxococcota bacterium]
MRALALALLMLSFSSVALAGPIDDVPINEWYRIPNSPMVEVAFDWSPESSPGNARAIVRAWGGGAWDSRENRMLVQGGGHGDYGGDEVYAMDLDVANDAPGTNPWARLSDPDARDALDPDCNNEDNLTDNDHRRSQHTYGRLAYVPSMHALCDTGGSIGYTFCPALRQLDCFDLETNAWRLAIADGESSGTGSTGAVHSGTGEWWLLGGASSGLLGRFDPESTTWTYGAFDNVPASSPRNMTMAIDPNRNLLVVIGSGRMWALSLDEFQAGETELSELPVESSGAVAIIDTVAPGFDYDPGLDRFVAWDGGASVFTLDPETWTWTEVVTAGDVPPEAQRRGTYGRFAYSVRYGVFVLVNDAEDDVYVLRLGPPCADCDAGPGPIPDAGARDAGEIDAAVDAGEIDAAVDAGGRGDADAETPGSSSGCGCRVARADATPGLLALVLLGLRRRT